MQIHELNNYSGNLDGSAYIAVDNGSDTGKVAVPSVLAEVNNDIEQLDAYLNGRIDNIIAGGDAPSVAEVTDARYGADGVTYPSLGDSIRGQISNVNYPNITEIISLKRNDKGITLAELEQGRYGSGSVTKYTSTNTVRSKFIIVDSSRKFTVYCPSGFKFWLTCADANEAYVTQGSVFTGPKEYDLSSYLNTRYVGINIRKTDDSDFTPADVPANSVYIYQAGTETEVANLSAENIGNIISTISMMNNDGGQNISVSFEQGRFYSGTGLPSLKYDNQPNWVRCTNPILVNPSLKYIVERTHSQRVFVYQYDKNYNYVTESEIYNSQFGKELTLNAATYYLNVAVYNSGGIVPSDLTGTTTTVRQIGEVGLPTYFTTQLDTKIPSIVAYMNDVGPNGSTFVFITDIHWDTNYHESPKLISQILKNANIDNVFCGGDVINEGAKAAMYKVFIDCVKNFQFPLANMFFPIARGNHDDNSNWGTPQEITTYEFDYNTVFNLLMNQVKNRVIRLTTTEFSFYFDETGSKTRYIFVDTQRTGQYIPFTEIIALLKTVPTGWHVIFVLHMVMRTSTTLFQGADLLAHIVKAYNDRTSGSYIGVSYDFTTGAVGTVELIIGGHMHQDLSLAANDANNPSGVPIICTDTDSYRDHPGTEGTVNSQCFDVVTCDYTNKTVKCVRIGRGNDRSFSY